MSTSTVTAPSGPVARQRSGSGRGIATLVGVLLLVGLVSLAVGNKSLPLGTVADVLLDPDGSEASTIVNSLRLPRTLLAIAVGAALGVAGALMQGHTRNPLA